MHAGLDLFIPFPFLFLFLFFFFFLIHTAIFLAVKNTHLEILLSYLMQSQHCFSNITPPSIPFLNKIQNYKNPTIHESQLLKIHVFCFWLCNQINPRTCFHMHILFPLIPLRSSKQE
ncbi:hypothetical protein EYC80_008894 [Monilinia laxa]|uniref:Uncharacterized protein n=1 Tax=Monilinia laxa TaxID=61186 RepID=A0A5N6K1U2_MONLA|nr:hypothetical protein EYC80_008894 [Monilinia laxa]